MSDNILFDNFIITDDRSVASAWAQDTWVITHDEEVAASGGVSFLLDPGPLFTKQTDVLQ